MTLHVKDGGTWKEVTNLYVKDGGSWKEVTSGQVKDGGSWKEFKTTGGGGGGGATYLIQYNQVTTGSNQSTANIFLDGTGSVSQTWTVTSIGSNPAGFYSSSSFATTGDGYGTINFQSNSNTASTGTTVYLNYRVSVVLGNGTADPLDIQIVHQF